MMSYLTQLYHDIRPEVYTAKRMKAEFERAGTLAEFSPDLFERTVQAVTIEKDASVSIVLINGQIIRKELRKSMPCSRKCLIAFLATP